MAQLQFTYDASEDGQRADYRGLVIRIQRDDSAGNPWQEWDGNAPLIVKHGRDGFTRYDKDAGLNLLRPFDSDVISDSLLRRHMKAICKAFDGFDVYRSFTGTRVASFDEWLESEARESQRDYGGSLTDIKRDLLADALDGLADSDKLDVLADIYRAIGWPALCTSSQGYSQGCYSELLFVATPAFIKAMGAPSIKDSVYWARDFESARKLYGAWAWGDVYGYQIETPAGEFLESCYGFYGDDFTESGLIESATSAADWIVENASARRFNKLRELIRARVPLAMRPALLSEAATLQGGF